MEVRCFVKSAVNIPNKSEFFIYGTHLEVNGTDDIRLNQLKEVSADIQTTLKNKNVIIAADFNATRTNSPLALMQQAGFKNSFSYLGWQHPHFTNWTGTEIDFIFLSPSWNLLIAGAYVYYDPK